MTCPFCRSPRVTFDYLATGDWHAAFACGTSTDDNGEACRTAECEGRAPVSAVRGRPGGGAE